MAKRKKIEAMYDDALVDGYDQNEEFYFPLLNNDELKKTVMHIFPEG
jgi:hypothetical protein